MFRCILVILTACFIFWILPLGVFITPAQEKLACNGQRAICLCTKRLNQDGKPAKLVVIINSSPQKEAASSGGSSHHFIAAELIHLQATLITSLLVNSSIIQSSNYLRSIDHVPKA